MADAYVPWIRGADPAGHFAPVYGEAANAASRRAQLGLEAARMQATVAQHQATLDAEREQMQQQMELKKEIQRQNFLQEQQRLEIQKQYNENRVAIQKQRADDIERVNQEKTLATARRMQAQAAIDDEVKRGMALNPNANQDQLRIRAMSRRIADLGLTGQGESSIATALSRFQQNAPITWERDPKSGATFARIGDRLYQERESKPGIGSPEELAKERRQANKDILHARITSLARELDTPGIKPKQQKEIEDKMDKLQNELDALYTTPDEGEEDAESGQVFKINKDSAGNLIAPPSLLKAMETYKRAGGTISPKDISAATIMPKPASPASAAPVALPAPANPAASQTPVRPPPQGLQPSPILPQAPQPQPPRPALPVGNQSSAGGPPGPYTGWGLQTLQPGGGQNPYYWRLVRPGYGGPVPMGATNAIDVSRSLFGKLPTVTREDALLEAGLFE